MTTKKIKNASVAAQRALAELKEALEILKNCKEPREAELQEELLSVLVQDPQETSSATL